MSGAGELPPKAHGQRESMRSPVRIVDIIREPAPDDQRFEDLRSLREDYNGMATALEQSPRFKDMNFYRAILDSGFFEMVGDLMRANSGFAIENERTLPTSMDGRICFSWWNGRSELEVAGQFLDHIPTAAVSLTTYSVEFEEDEKELAVRKQIHQESIPISMVTDKDIFPRRLARALEEETFSTNIDLEEQS